MVKVYCVSDIHTDYPSNLEHIKQLPAKEDSVLIVCGDISDNIKIIETTLTSLKSKYPAGVFFIPGNHELWCGRSDNCSNSMQKLNLITELCKRIGVIMSPTSVHEDLAIVPMFGWYHPSFDEDWSKLSDKEKKETFTELYTVWNDFRHCKWDIAHLDISKRFLDMNDRIIDDFMEKHQYSYPNNIITFSHFLPRRDLLPPKELLLYKSLPMVVGDTQLDGQLRKLGSNIHVYGHTHIDKDITIDKVKYVQNAFGSPHERTGWKKAQITGPYEPKLIYQDDVKANIN
ncbi:predicted protein [Heterostelium album PN500]|uniref:Calcineurin-like phosphoesterase domain-containing protein n=1 Tax=Heterostelium pallidum (strain ATCC 26659 / Pp 5 / PN500) TaxID=670386 RepID=D3AYY8_HETP5|nr:predicted protein [Heterostelium album PN500]EFA85678.1 predicted protein [Heterostelium album PN500]|eukprot:XP_020437785.1 predicted protein [Heterostelium album PN500]